MIFPFDDGYEVTSNSFLPPNLVVLKTSDRCNWPATSATVSCDGTGWPLPLRSLRQLVERQREWPEPALSKCSNQGAAPHELVTSRPRDPWALCL